MTRELIISSLVTDQEVELKKFLNKIKPLIEFDYAKTYYDSLARDYNELCFPTSYSAENFVSSILTASKQQEKLFPDFLKLLQEHATGQEYFNSFLRLKDSLVCLQELEDEFNLLRKTKVFLETQECDTYSIVNLCLTETYSSAFETEYTNLDFMQMLNKIGVAPPEKDKYEQPLITFIKKIEYIFSKKQKTELMKKVWTITERFLCLRHGLEKEDIQHYQNCFDQKNKEKANLEMEVEDYLSSVLISVMPTKAVKGVKGKKQLYNISIHKWQLKRKFDCKFQAQEPLSIERIKDKITNELSRIVQQEGISENPRKGIIEFFLPTSLFYLNVDLWEIKLREGGLDVPLGEEFYVVIRSQERLNSKEIQNNVQRRWEKFRNLERVDFCPINILSEDQKSLFKKMRHLDDDKCVSFSPRIDKSNVKLLTGFPESGIPVVYWSRSQDTIEQLKELEGLKLNQLLEKVYEMRQKDLYEVSLFWDDPSRYIPQANAQSP